MYWTQGHACWFEQRKAFHLKLLEHLIDWTWKWNIPSFFSPWCLILGCANGPRQKYTVPLAHLKLFRNLQLLLGGLLCLILFSVFYKLQSLNTEPILVPVTREMLAHTAQISHRVHLFNLLCSLYCISWLMNHSVEFFLGFFKALLSHHILG